MYFLDGHVVVSWLASVNWSVQSEDVEYDTVEDPFGLQLSSLFLILIGPLEIILVSPLICLLTIIDSDIADKTKAIKTTFK